MAAHKRKKKSKTATRRRRKKNPKAYRRRTSSKRRLKKNPRLNPRRRRRLRRNDGSAPWSVADTSAMVERLTPSPRPGRGFKGQWAAGIKVADTKQRKRVAKSLRSAATAMSKAAKKSKGVTKTVRMAQAARLRATAALVAAKGRSAATKSPLAKAMSIKSNPGLAGLKSAAMVLAPQAAVGAVGMVALAMAGARVSAMVKDKLPVSVQPYVPAIATVGLSAVAYVVADKVAPKYKGAIAIGGMLAAVLQVVAAAARSNPAGAASKAQAAFLGEYTTVGGGIFHGMGEYTTVGDAHPFRPRNFADDRMEVASDGSRVSVDRDVGADNAMSFAPGEGGILSGSGMFR
jgi:hypothetical protein